MKWHEKGEDNSKPLNKYGRYITIPTKIFHKTLDQGKMANNSAQKFIRHSTLLHPPVHLQWPSLWPYWVKVSETNSLHRCSGSFLSLLYVIVFLYPSICQLWLIFIIAGLYMSGSLLVVYSEISFRPPKNWRSLLTPHSSQFSVTTQ